MRDAHQSEAVRFEQRAILRFPFEARLINELLPAAVDVKNGRMRPRRIIRFLQDFRHHKRPNSTELVLRYLDGSLSEEDVERLDGQIKRDSGLRKAFADAAERGAIERDWSAT